MTTKTNKCYLVRIDYNRLVGPYDLTELKTAHKRAEYSLQDEICGNLGRWIAISDMEEVEVEYPELKSFIVDDMLAGWNIAEAKKTVVLADPNKSRIIDIVILVIVLFLVSGTAIVYFKKKEALGKPPLSGAICKDAVDSEACGK